MSFLFTVTSGNPAERLIIIAPGYRAFKEFCLDHDVNPQSHNARFADCAERIRGYRDTWYAFLGVPDGARGLELLSALRHAEEEHGFKDARKAAARDSS